MNKADLAARAARIAARPPAREATDADRPPAAMPAPRAKPIRVTVDLAPQTYRALLAFSGDLAIDLGRARIPHVEVIRALLAELETAPELQARVREAVTAQLRS